MVGQIPTIAHLGAGRALYRASLGHKRLLEWTLNAVEERVSNYRDFFVCFIRWLAMITF